MSLSKLLNFNLQFEQVHQREKGLFTFYREQLNSGTSARKEYFQNDQEVAVVQPKLKNLQRYQRNSQKLASKQQPMKSKNQLPFQNCKLNKIHQFNKRDIESNISKSLHKPSIANLAKITIKQMRIKQLKIGQSQKTMNIFNFDQKQYFKGQKNKKKLNINQRKSQKNMLDCLHIDDDLLRKLCLQKKEVGKSSANYVFPIFDENLVNLNRIRQFKNKTKIQQKININSGTNQKEWQQLSIHMSPQNDCNLQIHKKGSLKIFTQVPNLRKKSQTLTNRLRSFMKNKKSVYKKTIKGQENFPNGKQIKKFNQQIRTYQYQKNGLKIGLKKQRSKN